ncbi:MFS transporter [Gryllotalpicola reticulitermitis]|uniref:MFS transporter n=1 Tax=Gryllotalpicola reticulitermitis TaxID=1184153 RepID=A0ABV8Q716_9MICO
MAHSPAPTATVSRSQSIGRAARAGVVSGIGTSIEWYDFYLYGTAGALVFNKLFFPEINPLAGILASFGVFAAGFVTRPLGGIIFGHFGDRVGRKQMLIISMLIMGLSTFCVGLLPSYKTIGIWAPVLLVVLRVIQGLAVGGEWSGAALVAIENAPAHRRGLYGSFPQMGVPFGNLFSTLIFSLVVALPHAEFLSWGWRIPFLLSIVLVGVGLFVRLRLNETPHFEAVTQSNSIVKVPTAVALRHFPMSIVFAVGACFAPFIFSYFLTTFGITYGTTVVHLSQGFVLNTVAIASAVELVTMPFAGALSDKWGRRRTYLVGTIATAIVVIPFFLAVSGGSSAVWFIAVVFCTGFIHPLMYATLAAFSVELFPANIRYSATALGYQFGGLLGGGFAPLILTSLLAVNTHSFALIAAYIFFGCAVTLVCVIFATRRKPLIENVTFEQKAAHV